jgi:hypothetical protein
MIELTETPKKFRYKYYKLKEEHTTWYGKGVYSKEFNKDEIKGLVLKIYKIDGYESYKIGDIVKFHPSKDWCKLYELTREEFGFELL